MEQGFSVGAGVATTSRGVGFHLFVRPGAQLLLVFGAVLLAYFHTFDVPFYFDDYPSIRDNAAIRDFASASGFAPARAVGYLSFALNYALHEYSLWGYHLFNLLIHAAASLTVYCLARWMLATRAVAPHCTDGVRFWLPLLVALLFALHPLQTQAVTYIVQRLASMAALFYLLSMAAYLRGRLVEARGEQLLCFALAGVFALLAFLTKQNTVTLPLALLLMEVCLLRPRRDYLLALLGAGVASLVLIVLVFRFALGQSLLQLLAERAVETDTLTRGEYFSVQMQMLWDYLVKFVLPFGLHLDYDVAVPSSFWNARTLAFALGHVALIGGAVALIRRSPVIAFGILFYYVAHLVESSLIPIRDVGFEHRTYLPNFGLCLAAAWALLSILPRRLPARAIAGLCAALVLLLGALTWLRNDVWRDPIAFFQHETAVNPDNFRAHSMLGETHLRLGQADEALAAYGRAAALYGSMLNKETNAELAFLSNYVLALDEAGRYELALQVIEDNVELEALPRAQRALFLSRRGIIYAKTNRFELAEADFQAALQANGRHLDSLNNYAKLLLVTGRVEQARELYARVLEVDPASADPQLRQVFQNAP